MIVIVGLVFNVLMTTTLILRVLLFFSINGYQEFQTSIEDCISENNKLEYCKLVSDISQQLSKFYGLEESINPINSNFFLN